MTTQDVLDQIENGDFAPLDTLLFGLHEAGIYRVSTYTDGISVVLTGIVGDKITEITGPDLKGAVLAFQWAQEDAARQKAGRASAA
jgi:hypothetical protein